LSTKYKRLFYVAGKFRYEKAHWMFKVLQYDSCTFFSHLASHDFVRDSRVPHQFTEDRKIALALKHLNLKRSYLVRLDVQLEIMADMLKLKSSK